MIIIIGYSCFSLSFLLHVQYLPGATAYSGAQFGEGAGPVVMDDIRCQVYGQ